jgi:hypothetical protein
MITQEHAAALLLALAGDIIKESDRATAVDAIDILSELESGKRRILSESQSKLLVELMDCEVGNETIWSHLRRILSARMNDEAMNQECMEIYLVLNEMAASE